MKGDCGLGLPNEQTQTEHSPGGRSVSVMRELGRIRWAKLTQTVRRLGLTERRAKTATLNTPDYPENKMLAMCVSRRAADEERVIEAKGAAENTARRDP